MREWYDSLEYSRPLAVVLEDELADLAVLAPLTPAVVQETAPHVVERLGGTGELALHLLRERCDSEDKYIATVGAALGFNAEIVASSKQQRLSDFAVYHGRTGWRNMERWFRVGVSKLARKLLEEDGWPLNTLSVSVDRRGEAFDLALGIDATADASIIAVEVELEHGSGSAKWDTCWLPEYEVDEYEDVSVEGVTFESLPLEAEGTSLYIRWHSDAEVTVDFELEGDVVQRVQCNSRYALIELA